MTWTKELHGEGTIQKKEIKLEENNMKKETI